jgi:replication-associated recombination protein RarA
MSLLLHQLSQKRYDSFKLNPPQSLVLIAPAGSGKETILRQLALDILGDSPVGRLYEILPDDGKKTIGIDAIRELKMSLRLKSNKERVVLIDKADSLTNEAQNSILKLLEDTPKNVHFLISVNNKSSLLDTVISRSEVWNFIQPTTTQIKKFFDTYPEKSVEKAIAISGNRAGVISALLGQDEDHPLIQAIETAKNILSDSRYKRLVRVEVMSKNLPQTLLVLEALRLICKSALETSASKNDQEHLKQWQKRLQLCLEATDLINANIQPKLVLSRAFLMI